MEHRRVTFIESISLFFKNYATFKGRSSRSAYWWWTLASVIIGLLLDVVDYFIVGIEVVAANGGPISVIFSIATLVPSFAISFRRLQDVNVSGWWVFLVFTIIGLIPVFYWTLKRGTEGENKFGADVEAGKMGDLSPFEEINLHNNNQ